MKKLFPLFIVCFFLAGFFIFGKNHTVPATSENMGCRIYFVDKQLHRLVPTATTLERTSQKTAEKIVSELLSGRDRNNSILRIIPNIENGISVKLSGETAYVNLKSQLCYLINKNPETEKLVVYQIVNSLTSVDGIQYVRFTIDNEIKKDFLGFLDMREIFTANYDI